MRFREPFVEKLLCFVMQPDELFLVALFKKPPLRAQTFDVRPSLTPRRVSSQSSPREQPGWR